MMPLFTFVVPVYKTEDLLPKCLDSIRDQSDADFEVVVVDDCSSGDCRGIVSRYDERFRHVRHDKNRSLLQARLTGLRQAKGQFIIPVDSDDYVARDLVANLRTELTAHPDSDIIAYHTMIDDGSTTKPAWHNHVVGRCSCREALQELFDAKMFWTMWGKSFRASTYRSAMEGLGVGRDFYINSTEDLCQMLPILLLGNWVSFIDYPGYYYYQNPASMTKSLDSERKIRPVAEQNSLCIRLVAEHAKAKGCDADTIGHVKMLSVNTIRWLLEETRDSTDKEWSRVVNTLCRCYGTWPVLREGIVHHQEFLKRYVPDPDVFPPSSRKSVETIGVICHDWRGGGAERANWLWMREMARSGKSLIWFYDESQQEAVGGKPLPSGIDAIPLAAWETERRVQDLTTAIEANGIDTVVIIDHWRPTVFTDLLTAKCHGCRVIVAEHNTFLFPLDDLNPALYIGRNNFYPLADAVTVLSPENVAWWHAQGLSNVVLMPNLLTFSEKGKAAKELPQGRLDVLFVGRICRRKNYLAAVEAFKLFCQAHHDIAMRSRLVFLGRYENDSDRTALEGAISRSGLSDSIAVAGEVSDVASYYGRAALLIVTSRLEGAPMVIMEAKSYGLPTVMFELPYVSGTTEQEGVVSVPHGDTQAMAESIYACLSDRNRYRRLSQAAKCSLASFSTGQIMRRWDSVFNMLETGVVDSMSDSVPSDRLMSITMQGIESVASVMLGWKGYMEGRQWQQDKVLSDARQNMSSAQQELSAVRSALEVERAVAASWAAEAKRLALSRSYKIGRAVTWPYRMARGTAKALLAEGARATCRRAREKVRCLKARFCKK